MAREDFRIPLLRDRHTHPLLYAALADALDLKKHSQKSGAEIVELIRRHAEASAGQWRLVYGWSSERHELSKPQFDDLPPLVIFNLSFHDLIVNDAGRALLRRSDPDVVPHLDDRHWIERNLRKLLNYFARGASIERLQGFFRTLLEEHGVYYAEELLLVNEHEIQMFDDAGLSDRTAFWAAPDLYDVLPPTLQQRVYGIKLFTDGALGASTAALSRPFRTTSQNGVLMYEQEDLTRILKKYLARGKPVALHAIGDLALDRAVAAIAAAGPRPADEVRIEHAQLISLPTAKRAKSLGIRLCMQPNFSSDSEDYFKRLPDGFPQRNNPFRMLIDEAGYVPGVDLWFGSDGMPHGALNGLQQALFPKQPGQKLSLAEFKAGYCLPNEDLGHIAGSIDWTVEKVTCRVMIANRPAAS